MGEDLRRFFVSVARSSPRRLVGVTLVQAISTLSQVAGLFLLVPMLGAVGVATTGSTDGIVEFWRKLFDGVGIDLTLRSMLVVYVVTVGVAAALNAYSNVLMARYQVDYTNRLRTNLYQAVARAEWRHLVTIRGSDLMAMATTNVARVSVAALGTLTLAATLLVAVAQFAVAARLSLPVTLLAAVASAGLVLVVWPFVGHARRAGREGTENVQRMFAAFRGFLDGMKLVKAHAREQPHVEEFNAIAGRVRDAELQLARASAVANAVQLVATAAVLAVVVDVAVEGFEVEIASLLVLAFVFMRLVPQLTTVQRNVQQIVQGLPAFDALECMQRACEEAAEADDPGEERPLGSGVSLRHVSFAYETRQVLDDVSFDVPAGATVALVGPSGAGKTTAVDIVVGLLEPASGDVLVDGQSLGRLTRRWRESIALVPQEPFLFNETVRTNLAWAVHDADEPAMWDALRQAAAAELVRALPDGLDTLVGDRGVRLSGGERQRIALARALLRAPQLLILDEATSSLDTENERAIRAALNGLHGQLTMLVIAHRLSTVRHADHVIVLDEGRVVEQGPWDDLVRQSAGRLRALVEAGLVD